MSRHMTPDELRRHRQSHTKQNSWWLKDAKGIEVARVCEHCQGDVEAQYDPAIFGHGPNRYEDVVEERIEPDDP